ncbi:hypothetical protein ACIPYQ_16320 [Streptomyces sp. NPDC090045]|uniref:hypothetical protein n=1 Tax=Streptomyces sp. NPDC090045 TaxID=3365927 RepID=UPI00381400D9
MTHKVLVVAFIVTFAALAAVVAGACLRRVGAERPIALGGGGAAFVATVTVGFVIASYLRS